MTAVEWFYQRILAKDINEVFEQAKEMEKQQIIDAYDLGSLSEMQYPNPKTVIENGEQYYNKTYGSKGSEHIEDNLVEITYTEEQLKLAYMQGYNRHEA